MQETLEQGSLESGLGGAEGSLRAVQAAFGRGGFKERGCEPREETQGI